METLAGIKACAFDAYGTLFDFATATASCREELGDRIVPLSAPWLDKQLQCTWLRTIQGQHADFFQVTSDALDHSKRSRFPVPVCAPDC